MFPAAFTQIFARFLLVGSLSVDSATGKTIFRPLSLAKTVVTMKKIKSRKAMSAMDEVGTTAATPDFRLNFIELAPV
jgi:hypothetical protein